MDEIIDMLEPAGLAEEEILDPFLQFDILHALEPDELALVCAVEECSGEALRASDTDGMPLGDLADDLNVSSSSSSAMR